MSFDQATFDLRFPELAGQDAQLVSLIVEDAECLIGNESSWCDGKYPVALMYLTAHLLGKRVAALAGTGSGGTSSGPITNKTAKGVSVSYAQPAGGVSKDDAFYLTSEYGKFYVQLRNKCFTGLGVTVAVNSVGSHGCIACGNFNYSHHRHL